MPDIKILERRTLSEHHGKLESISIEKKHNGETQTLERVLFHRPPAAAILLYDQARKSVILTKQFRLPVYLDNNQQLLEACAGLLDEGELPEHAIVREVEEETGFRISEIEKVAEGYTSPSSFTEYVHFFVGKYTPDMRIAQGGGLKEEGEYIDVLEFTGEEIRHKLRTNEVKDVKTILLLQHALLNNLI
ncbi:NUDIX domain-containing protein [Desertivirga brevis]|uniref:NUDIX domain-containing protein n=1 Tax=Desertivirga brevis TaxID=2810310 RepID=UPI001A95D928|nr:NUDIX domain-containing protein [Pedobacter sp. SYSU D00873]